MKKVTRIILLVLIVVSVVIWAVYPRFDEIFPSSEANAGGPPSGFRGGGPLPVSATVLEPRQLENKIKVTGSVLANESLELKSEVAGLITGIHFTEGQKVRKGQLLVSLKDDELQAQLEKAKFNKKLNEETEFRQRKLLEKEAISREEYDIALNTLNTSEADIRVIEAQIAKTAIRAPFNGTIGLRQISEGAYITTSSAIANIYNIDFVKIEFSIPGKYAGEVKKGDKIHFDIDAYSETFEGEVYAVEPQINANTRTLTMRAISPNADGRLLPGQFARIELIMETIDDALLLPTEAVVPELNGHKVYLAKSGKAESRVVTIGLRTDERVQIVDGLQAADTVITSGILQMRPGAAVTVKSLKN